MKSGPARTIFSRNNKKNLFKKLIIPGGNTLDLPRKRREPQAAFVAQVPPVQDGLDWRNRWPSAASFTISAPLPIRQGIVRNSTENHGIIPEAKGNQELMKIPNFLHLTPEHISTQCKAIKDYCTKWPKGLKTDEDIQKHYPVEVTTRDFIRSGQSIRDENARFVTMKIPLKILRLDNRAMDKFKLLVGEKRLVGEGDDAHLVLESGRCPTRAQNYGYLRYVLVALIRESQKVHPWESHKDEMDDLTFDWENSSSKKKVVKILKDCDKSEDVESMRSSDLESYGEVLKKIVNGGEDEETLHEYKESVLRLLGHKKAKAAS